MAAGNYKRLWEMCDYVDVLPLALPSKLTRQNLVDALPGGVQGIFLARPQSAQSGPR
jgi:hypothetical protein